MELFNVMNSVACHIFINKQSIIPAVNDGIYEDTEFFKYIGHSHNLNYLFIKNHTVLNLSYSRKMICKYKKIVKAMKKDGL